MDPAKSKHDEPLRVRGTENQGPVLWKATAFSCHILCSIFPTGRRFRRIARAALSRADEGVRPYASRSYFRNAAKDMVVETARQQAGTGPPGKKGIVLKCFAWSLSFAVRHATICRRYWRNPC
jgi:hypothetical protein